MLRQTKIYTARIFLNSSKIPGGSKSPAQLVEIGRRVGHKGLDTRHTRGPTRSQPSTINRAAVRPDSSHQRTEMCPLATKDDAPRSPESEHEKSRCTSGLVLKAAERPPFVSHSAAEWRELVAGLSTLELVGKKKRAPAVSRPRPKVCLPPACTHH